jgi:AcrR family transcriptional regulator
MVTQQEQPDDAPARDDSVGKVDAKVDGRHLRSLRTRQRIIDAYLELAAEMSPRIPTAAQIADRAGCSARSVFERFPDIHSLQVAVVNFAVTLIVPPPPPREGDDRQTRIRAQVESRSRSCQTWLPLWRSLIANQGDSAELRQHVVRLRQGIMDRLSSMYAPELATVPEAERRRLLIILEALTDNESWARMQEYFGLSSDEARATWQQAIDRLLPPTPSAS